MESLIGVGHPGREVYPRCLLSEVDSSTRVPVINNNEGKMLQSLKAQVRYAITPNKDVEKHS